MYTSRRRNAGWLRRNMMAEHRKGSRDTDRVGFIWSRTYTQKRLIMRDEENY